MQVYSKYNLYYIYL